MSDLEDLELDKTTTDPPHSGREKRAPLMVMVAAALVAALVIGYVGLRWRARQAPDQTTTEPANVRSKQAPELRPEPGEDIALPPLDQTDPLVRQLVQRLSSHPRVAAWLATEGLIHNFTVVTLNISNGETPAAHLRPLALASRFRATEAEGTFHIDPRSYQRYDTYADAVAGLDARGTARLYATLKPRITEASREVGSSNGDFDPVLERAIVELLRVPVVDGVVPLKPKIISYAFADPRLESLSAAQRQFLRMGPRNVRMIQGKLREIASDLAIPSSRLPQLSERSR